MKPGDLVFVANDATWIHCHRDGEYVSAVFKSRHFHEGEPMIVLGIFTARWRSKNAEPVGSAKWVEVLTAYGKTIIAMRAFDATR